MEPAERNITAQTRKRIAALAGVADEAWMQDWPLEVADPRRLGEFVALLQRAETDDDCHALMNLVLYSLDEAEPDEQRAAWPSTAAILEQRRALFAYEIEYWSCVDADMPDHRFAITPLMREVRVRGGN